mmetsp:Transcript_26625/g.70824  ORF Transcript_26625/g.70824 Transcript_26625/m.70824 type:complete len:246 (+) Transcript_26625:228-965(+)
MLFCMDPGPADFMTSPAEPPPIMEPSTPALNQEVIPPPGAPGKAKTSEVGKMYLICGSPSILGNCEAQPLAESPRPCRKIMEAPRSLNAARSCASSWTNSPKPENDVALRAAEAELLDADDVALPRGAACLADCTRSTNSRFSKQSVCGTPRSSRKERNCRTGHASTSVTSSATAEASVRRPRERPLAPAPAPRRSNTGAAPQERLFSEPDGQRHTAKAAVLQANVMAPAATVAAATLVARRTPH